MIVWPVIRAQEDWSLSESLEIFQHDDGGVNFVTLNDNREETIKVD